MHKLHAGYRIALTLLAVAFVLGLAASASADTIYLKNGRTIRSSSVRIDGDRVIFIQYAGEVSIPLALVDRIVEDASVEPEGAPPPVVVAPAMTADSESGLEGPEPEPEEVPPEQTRDYWQDQCFGPSRAERAARSTWRMEDLRRTERAFLFSSRSTAEVPEARCEDEASETHQDLDEELEDLHTGSSAHGDSRRVATADAGRRPGWPRGGQSGQGG